MIILIDGDNNAGKTIFLVHLSEDIQRPIWSNFKLFKHPYYEELTQDKIVFLDEDFDYKQYPKGLVIFIDEAYTYFDSRLSSQTTNIYLSHKVNYQWRKRLLDVYLTFQDFSSIDKRFKDPIRWDIYISCEYRTPESKDDFVYNYYRNKKKGKNRGKKMFYTLRIPYNFMTKYFDHYDTNEIVENPNIARLEYNMAVNDTRLMKNMLNRYYDKLINKIPQFFYNGIKFNHENVKLFLIQNNVYEKFEPKLYVMLKNKIRL